MAIRYGVQADTREECLRALQDLCSRLGARPAMLPSDTFGNGWLARAVLLSPTGPENEHGQQ